METTEKRHYAVVDSYPRKITITHEGRVIAGTTNALILKEVGMTVYNPVYYVPKEDLVEPLVPETERSSHCPIKGDASYWNYENNPTSEYFAWSYEEPLPRAKKIKGHVAFNPKYVSILSEPI